MLFVLCVRNVAFTVLLANVMHFSIGRGNIINFALPKEFKIKIGRSQKKNYESSIKNVGSYNKNRPTTSSRLRGSRPPSWENPKKYTVST